MITSLNSTDESLCSIETPSIDECPPLSAKEEQACFLLNLLALQAEERLTINHDGNPPERLVQTIRRATQEINVILEDSEYKSSKNKLDIAFENSQVDCYLSGKHFTKEGLIQLYSLGDFDVGEVLERAGRPPKENERWLLELAQKHRRTFFGGIHGGLEKTVSRILEKLSTSATDPTIRAEASETLNNFDGTDSWTGLSDAEVGGSFKGAILQGLVMGGCMGLISETVGTGASLAIRNRMVFAGTARAVMLGTTRWGRYGAEAVGILASSAIDTPLNHYLFDDPDTELTWGDLAANLLPMGGFRMIGHGHTEILQRFKPRSLLAALLILDRFLLENAWTISTSLFSEGMTWIPTNDQSLQERVATIPVQVAGWYLGNRVGKSLFGKILPHSSGRGLSLTTEDIELAHKKGQRDFSNMDLSNMDLSHLDLKEANLRGTHLPEDVNKLPQYWNGAQLDETHVSTLSNLSGANLSSLDLKWVNLENKNFQGANLTGTNLTRAWLKGANLSHSILDNADLSHADLKGANLTGASCKSTTFHEYDLKLLDMTNLDLSNALILGMQDKNPSTEEPISGSPMEFIFPLGGDDEIFTWPDGPSDGLSQAEWEALINRKDTVSFNKTAPLKNTTPENLSTTSTEKRLDALERNKTDRNPTKQLFPQRNPSLVTLQ